MGNSKKHIVIEAQVSPIEQEEQYQTVTANILEHVNDTTFASNESMKGVFEDLKTAALDPVVSGRPRMLHITAIIVHEGVNHNNDGFYAQDLQTIVSERKLFKDGYGGMIDINHDLMPVGYWYDAEYITDPVTHTSGILAKGAIWAWRFPEIADKILAYQHRDGKVAVSMTCLCKDEDIKYETTLDGNWIQWVKDPVFVATTILLDQTPGDPNARGVADEDPIQITETERRSILFRAAANNDNSNIMEETMLDEFKPLLEEKLGDNANSVIDAINKAMSSLEERLDTRNTEIEALMAAKSELSEQNSTLQTQVEEQKLVIEELTAKKAELEGTTATLTAKVEEFEAAEAAAAFEKKKEARLAELSESVIERLNAKEQSVRDAIVERWASQTEDEWEITKAEHALAAASDTRVERLPGGARGYDENGANSLDKYIR